MSRAYRIKIANFQCYFHEDKEVILDIDLLPILAESEMKELLAKNLEAKGGKRQKDIITVEQENGVKYQIDLKELKINISFDKVTRKKELSINVYEEQLSKEIMNMANNKGEINIDMEDINKIQNTHLENQLLGDKSDMQKIIIQECLKARQFINGVLKDVYRDAVKQKAESLGNVTSMTESNQDGEYRIRLEIQ